MLIQQVSTKVVQPTISNSQVYPTPPQGNTLTHCSQPIFILVAVLTTAREREQQFEQTDPHVSEMNKDSEENKDTSAMAFNVIDVHIGLLSYSHIHTHSSSSFIV